MNKLDILWLVCIVSWASFLISNRPHEAASFLNTAIIIVAIRLAKKED